MKQLWQRRDALDASFEERWRQRFQTFATDSDDDAGIAGWSKTGLAVRLRSFRRIWKGDQPGTLWLDAGCGAGTYSRCLSSHGIDVLGMDYSMPTLCKARSRSGEVKHWCVADVTRLPLKAKSVDGAICFGVTQALSNSEGAVTALWSVVKPGGQVWIDALNSWCLYHQWERLSRWANGRPPHLRYESPWSLRKKLKETGAHNVQLYWIPIVPARFRRLQESLETPFVQALLRYVPLVGAFLSHAVVLSASRGKA